MEQVNRRVSCVRSAVFGVAAIRFTRACLGKAFHSVSPKSSSTGPQFNSDLAPLHRCIFFAIGTVISTYLDTCQDSTHRRLYCLGVCSADYATCRFSLQRRLSPQPELRRASIWKRKHYETIFDAVLEKEKNENYYGDTRGRDVRRGSRCQSHSRRCPKPS